MAIEKAGDGEQTKLVEESREEQLFRLFQMESDIMKKRELADQYRNNMNAVKNDIKAKEKDKLDLMDQLARGQTVFVAVADTAMADEPEEDNSDIPSAEELAAFDTDADETEQMTLEDTPAVDGDVQEDLPDAASNEEHVSETYDAQIATTDEETSEDTQNPVENVTQLRPSNYWILADHKTDVPLGRMKCKKEPTIGSIMTIPVEYRQADKNWFIVRDYEYNNGFDDPCWVAKIQLLDKAEWDTATAAQSNGLPY